MSGTPGDRVIEPAPMRVYIETAPNSGEYRLDPRASVVSLTRGCDAEAIGACEIEVWAGPVDAPSLETEAALNPASVMAHMAREGTDFRQYAHPDQRVMIARDLPASAADEDAGIHRQVLFAGFCEQPRYEQTQGDGAIRERYRFLVEGMWKRVNLEGSAQIVGRWMRNRAAFIALMKFVEQHTDEDGVVDKEELHKPFKSDAEGSALDDLVNVEAEPCIFNEGGRPNRSATPIEVEIDLAEAPIEEEGGGEDEEATSQKALLHVFTHDRDPQAEYWTWAQALRYLMFFHVLDLSAETEPIVTAELERNVYDGNVFAETEKPTSADEETKIISATTQQRPASPVTVGQAMEFALLGRPSNYDVDGMSVGEALNLAMEAAGLHYRVADTPQIERYEDEEGNSGTRQTGRPRSALHIWARGAGPMKNFRRWGADILGSDPDIVDLLCANNLSDLAIAQDYTDVFPNARLIGDIERYECTFELVPGWKPDEHLDNLAGGAIAAKLALAKEHHPPGDESMTVEEGLNEDPWYLRYHKLGTQFEQYRQVGRRWVLNEDGRYVGRDADNEYIYARTVGPFNEDAYAPWDPTKCAIKRPALTFESGHWVVSRTVAQELAADDWVLRPRPFRECFSADADRHTLGIVVEVTPDNAAGLDAEGLAARRWTRLTGVQVLTLSPHASIYLDAEDLTQVFPWASDDTIVDEDGDPLSLWAALVESRLGLRVTAVIEGDQRMRPAEGQGGYHPIATQATRVIDMAAKFKANWRDCANSIYGPGGDREVDHEVEEASDDDDLLDLQRTAETMLALFTARVQPGALRVPWICEEYQIGDTIQQIEGTGIVFWSHGDTNQSRARHPDIVSVRTTPSGTEFFLEDTRMLEELTAKGLNVGRGVAQVTTDREAAVKGFAMA